MGRVFSMGRVFLIALCACKYLSVFDQVAGMVRILGAEGGSARLINGTYEPVDEGAGIVYRQRGNPYMWLEWYAPYKWWIVTDTEGRGTSAGYATLHCGSLRLPSDPRGAKWEVLHAVGDWREQPGVIVRDSLLA